MSNCPLPLVPEEVDLTDFKFMPLEVARLLQSEWWVMACMEDMRRCGAAVNLWSIAWHQRPAGSLPSNEAVLAMWARVPMDVWREIRGAVMEPWVLCSDGRWYHPVVAEKANEAWIERLEYQKRKADFSAKQRRKINKRWSKSDQNSPEDTLENTVVSSTVIPAVIPMKETGTGTGTGTGIKKRDKSLLSDADASGDPDFSDLPITRLPIEGYTAEFEAWWAIYPRKDGKGAAFKAFKAAKGKADVATLVLGAAAYAKRRAGEDPQYTKQPATWLNSDCWHDGAPHLPAKRKYPPGYVPQAANGG